MAAPIIKVKRSAVAGKIPTIADLGLGELAINTYDGKVYIEQDQGGVGVGTTIITINPWSVGLGSNAYNTYFTAGSVGVGTTNPGSKLTVNGAVQIQQDSGSNNRLIFRGQPGSSYRWNVDNYGSANDFRIFREDDATAANGASLISISTTGTLTATKFSGDGSLLTGIIASGSGVVIQNQGSNVGTAGTINFSTNLTASFSSGTATISLSNNPSITGILTADQVYTSNNGNGQNVRIGDDFWIGDVNVSNTTRFSGAQDSTKAFIIFGSSDAVALGRTGTGPLYYGGDFTISGVATANSFRARGGAPGAVGVNNNGYGFFSPGDNDSGMYSSADGQIEFYTNNTEAVRIDSNQRVGIGTTNPTSRLDVVGDAKVSGVITASSFSGNASSATYATTAGVATALQNARTITLTGDVSGSVSFDGSTNVSIAATIQPNSVALGTDTTGDYVQSISGTSNQIDVSATSGEGSTPTLSIPSQFTAPQDVTVTRDLQVNRNLNVTGNITIGGTSAFVNVQQLQVYDQDLVLGFRTDGSGNDVSNDTTANHGGIAIASTEGNPLVSLYNPGIGESTVSTYKKIMWFKSGSFAGLNTDAWLINYAVGIGSTQFPSGTRLAAGSVQFTERDLAVVRNINASGVSTLTQISANGTVGTAGSVLSSTGSGLSWIPAASTTRTVTRSIATDGQTSFSVTYTVGYIDVYLNGSKLDSTEYTASNGTSVVLVEGASINDVLEFISYSGISLSGTTIVDDNAFNSTLNITLTDATSGSISSLRTASSELTFNPGTNTFSTGNINSSGISTFLTIIPTETRIQNVAEKLSRVDGNTVSIAYTGGGGNTGFATNPTGDITLNVTGIPTDSSFDNYSISFSVIVNQTGTARSCTAVNLNGVSRTIKWFGGSLASAISGVTTTNGYDIYNFTGINTVGSASTAANYQVLGIVNGGFR